MHTANVKGLVSRLSQREILQFRECLDKEARELQVEPKPASVSESPRFSRDRCRTSVVVAREGSSPLHSERLDANVLVIHSAVRIVTLKGDRSRTGDSAAPAFASAIPIRRLRPSHDLVAVHVDRDGLAVYDDVLREPLVVPGR